MLSGSVLLTLIAAAPAVAQWSSATSVSAPDQYAQTPVVAADGQGDPIAPTSTAPTVAGKPAAPRQLTIGGRTRGAHAVTVRLMRAGHVYARAKARIRRGCYRAMLDVTKVPRGHYTAKITLFALHSTRHQRRAVFLAG